MIEAKIIADSISPSGVRLTTYTLAYPRFIHSEFMTHRMFSRNASSSRAVPVKKQIQMVIDNPAMPLEFRKNQKGMQAGEAIPDQELARQLWLQARDAAVEIAQKMLDIDVHKQYVNRLLEPFTHISVVVTSTDYDNFFALRLHSDAQPEIIALAEKMYALYQESAPQPLNVGEWHLPFITGCDRLECLNYLGASSDKSEVDALLIKRSVAKCARVSYLNHDGKPSSVDEDIRLYEKLLGSQPLHASPAEHQATPLEDPNARSGNFRGWMQFRKTLVNENVTDLDKYIQSLPPDQQEKYPAFSVRPVK